MNRAPPSFDQGWSPNENNIGFNGPPTMNNNWGMDGGPWPMHAKVPIQSVTLTTGAYAAAPGTYYWENRDTNVARADGSARTYHWVEIAYWTVGVFYTPPTGSSYTCGTQPRLYLYDGNGSPVNGATNGASGWLAD